MNLKMETNPVAARPLRVLLVEDMGMFRAFLEKWLAGLPQFTLAGSVGSAEEALAIMDVARPEVLIVDLQLPGIDGLELVRAARQTRPQVRALVLSSLGDALALTRVRESGVEGYVEKDAPPALLEEALEAVAAGRRFFSSRFSETLEREGAKALAVGKVLSRREQEVLSHVLAGKTSREVSELIGLSARTVEFHRANIMGKLGAANPTDLVARARQMGLR